MRISASLRHNATCAPDKAHTQAQSYADAMESHGPQAWRRKHDGMQEKIGTVRAELDLETADEIRPEPIRDDGSLGMNPVRRFSFFVSKEYRAFKRVLIVFV